MAVALATSDRQQFRVAGRGFIAGTAPNGLATINDAPASVEIDLFDRATRQWLRRTWSRQDGTYRFNGLATSLHLNLTGRDPSRTWQDVIVGDIQPWPYP